MSKTFDMEETSDMDYADGNEENMEESMDDSSEQCTTPPSSLKISSIWLSHPPPIRKNHHRTEVLLCDEILDSAPRLPDFPSETTNDDLERRFYFNGHIPSVLLPRHARHGFPFEEDNAICPVPITPSSGPMIPTLDSSSSEEEENPDDSDMDENRSLPRSMRHAFCPVVPVQTSYPIETTVVESKGIQNLKLTPPSSSAGLDLGTNATATTYGALAA